MLVSSYFVGFQGPIDVGQTIAKMFNSLSRCPNHEKTESRDELDKYYQKSGDRLNRLYRKATGRCIERR